MEIFMLLATVLSAVIGAVSNAMTNKENAENAEQQLENQQEFSHNEAILANDRALQNYYQTQSPEARLQQIKDAGLSVGLMYGGQANGGINTSPQASTPGANLPIMQSVMGNGLNDIFENLKKLSEKENTEEDTEKKKQEIDKIKSDIDVNNETIKKIATENNLTEVLTQNEKFDGLLKQIEISVQEATRENRIEIVKTQLDNLKNESEKLLQEIEGLKIDNDKKEEIYNATLLKMSAEISLIWKQTIKTQAETCLINTQTKLTHEQTKLSHAQRLRLYKDMENLQKMMAKVDAEIDLIESQTEKTDQETKLTKKKQITEVIGWFEHISKTMNNMSTTITGPMNAAAGLMK